MPANTLPPITRISANDAKRIIMPSTIYVTIPNFVKEYWESVPMQKILTPAVRGEIRYSRSKGV
ncbi:MAG TPA: hypothetical protein VLB68_00920 [Pyrinomonadaceae bacterium]|nr:hypothetical protein [Pyrinomonadaceae bacterium]